MRSPQRRSLVCLAPLWLTAVACAAPTSTGDGSPDGADEVGITAGKGDGSGFSECELQKVVELLNDASTDLGMLRNAGVHSRAAGNLMAHRNGQDGVFGTGDDQPFADITAVDDVSWVGPVAIRQLVAVVTDRCAATDTADVEVIFSPQTYESSHLARTKELLDSATRSIDVAMYSFSDSPIREALERAVARGVSIRVILEAANAEHAAPSGTMSARLEDAGMDVRWINKIMHHKFAIIDGVRSDLDDPAEAILVTGSGNWSNSAGTRYDENTLVIRRNAELALRFQGEFNTLWNHSRDLEWNASLEYFESLPITDAMIEDDPAVDAAFTSANFRTTVSSSYGNTFSVERGRNAISDRLVELIGRATRSVHVASGHLRSRPVAEALMAKHAADPAIDIRIYLDDQEWISYTSHAEQVRDLESCLASAGDSESRRQDCIDRGFYFGYQAHLEGIPVRYKFYAYRWDYSYAVQMHHKFMIVDGRWLATGSYNLSDNAEHNTMENMIFLDGAAYPATVASYEQRFEQMWVTGESEGLYDSLMENVSNGTGSFPIVFESMALDWPQVDALKRAIRDACPNINTAPFRDNPTAHRFCNR